MRLYDCAPIIRSKNAGPFTLTIDLMFDTPETFQKVLTSPNFTEHQIATLYHVSPANVNIHPFPPALTIKVTLPRPTPTSGAPGDHDVYGCQQHFPLGDLEV